MTSFNICHHFGTISGPNFDKKVIMYSIHVLKFEPVLLTFPYKLSIDMGTFGKNQKQMTYEQETLSQNDQIFYIATKSQQTNMLMPLYIIVYHLGIFSKSLIYLDL